MQKYRLNENAKKFVRRETENLELTMPEWTQKGFSWSALEKVHDTKPIVSVVDNVLISETETSKRFKSSSWKSGDVANFYFTVKIENCQHKLYGAIANDPKIKTAFTRAIEDAAKKFINEIKVS